MHDDKPGITTTPVYVPYATLISALDTLRTYGIPGTGKIDKTLWDSQSGAIQGQLLLAFRFLGLIDEKNRVLPALPSLVDAQDRKPILKKVIEEKYGRLLSLDLTTITQGQLDEAMRAYGVSGSTLMRATRFFVKACTELGIPISKRIAEKVRGGTSAPRKRRSAASSSRREPDNSEGASGPSGFNNSRWEEKLLDKFPPFDPAWPDELKTEWFAGFKQLMGAKPSQAN